MKSTARAMITPVPSGFSISESMNSQPSGGDAATSCWKLSPVEHRVEGEEDRQLEQQREAGGQRIDLVLAVEPHHRLLLTLLVVLVLLLDRLELRLQGLHRPHRLICLKESGMITSRTVNVSATIDGPQPSPTVSWKNTTIASGMSVKMDAIGSIKRDRPPWSGCGLEERRNSRRSLTWSTPPLLSGLHRTRRQTARIVPRTAPSSRTDCSA